MPDDRTQTIIGLIQAGALSAVEGRKLFGLDDLPDDLMDPVSFAPVPAKPSIMTQILDARAKMERGGRKLDHIRMGPAAYTEMLEQCGSSIPFGQSGDMTICGLRVYVDKNLEPGQITIVAEQKSFGYSAIEANLNKVHAELKIHEYMEKQKAMQAELMMTSLPKIWTVPKSDIEALQKPVQVNPFLNHKTPEPTTEPEIMNLDPKRKIRLQD